MAGALETMSWIAAVVAVPVAIFGCFLSGNRQAKAQHVHRGQGRHRHLWRCPSKQGQHRGRAQQPGERQLGKYLFEVGRRDRRWQSLLISECPIGQGTQKARFAPTS